MRLKRKVMAAIIIVTLVVTGTIAFLINGTVQGGRIAYVSIEVDKESFLSGEEVTFKLVPLQQIDFGLGDGEVRVVRIPDGVDPNELLNNMSEFSKIWQWESSAYNMASVPFSSFNSSGEMIPLSWNGTIAIQSPLTEYNLSYFKPTSGYYLLVPHFSTFYGHNVQFMLDKNAIFYIDSLQVLSDFKLNFENGSSLIDPALNLSYHSISLDSMSCEFHGALGSGGLAGTEFFNRSFSLEKDKQVRVSFPSQTQVYYDYSWDGIIETPAGSFAYGWQQGNWGGSNGEWTYISQY